MRAAHAANGRNRITPVRGLSLAVLACASCAGGSRAAWRLVEPLQPLRRSTALFAYERRCLVAGLPAGLLPLMYGPAVGAAPAETSSVRVELYRLGRDGSTVAVHIQGGAAAAWVVTVSDALVTRVRRFYHGANLALTNDRDRNVAYALDRRCPETGMTKQQIIAMYGNPADSSTSAELREWFYRLGREGQHLRVRFVGDTVAGWAAAFPTP